MEGWISLHRQIMENEFYFAERFTKMQAWIDLLLLANHKPATFYIRGNEIKLNEGQLGYSQLTLSKRWKWNKRTVDKFLMMLQKREMIHYKKSHLTTIISILNWNEFQKSAQQNAPLSNNRMHTDNNVNNDNKKHGLFSKNDKAGKKDWRHRKRNNNETILIDEKFIQSYFSRKINQNDIDEINNIAEKYGTETVIEFLTRLTGKIYSTKIFTEEKLEALHQELIYKKNAEADKKNKGSGLNLLESVFPDERHNIKEIANKFAIN